MEIMFQLPHIYGSSLDYSSLATNGLKGLKTPKESKTNDSNFLSPNITLPAPNPTFEK
jgi:hypothetical protein